MSVFPRLAGKGKPSAAPTAGASPRVSSRESLFGLLDRIDKGEIIAKADQSATENADNQRRSYVLDYLTTDIDNPKGRPLYASEDDFKKSLSEEAQTEKIASEFPIAVAKGYKRAGEAVDKNLETVLGSGNGNYDDKLANIAGEEVVILKAETDKREMLTAYGNLNFWNEVIKKYGKPDEDFPFKEEALRKALAGFESKRMYNYMRAQGYDEKTARAAAQSAQIEPSDAKLTAEKVIEGSKEAASEAQKELERRYGNNVRQDVANAVGKSLKRAFESGDEKIEHPALSSLYKAETGYHLGERSFRKRFSKAG